MSSSSSSPDSSELQHQQEQEEQQEQHQRQQPQSVVSILKRSLVCKDLGNSRFASHDYEGAAIAYEEGLSFLRDIPATTVTTAATATDNDDGLNGRRAVERQQGEEDGIEQESSNPNISQGDNNTIPDSNSKIPSILVQSARSSSSSTESSSVLSHYEIFLEQQEHRIIETRIALHSNLALSYLKQRYYEKSECECTSAIELLLCSSKQQQSSRVGDGGNNSSASTIAKIWYRRAQAREKLCDFENAEVDIRKCLDLLSSPPPPVTNSETDMISGEQRKVQKVGKNMIHEANAAFKRIKDAKKRQLCHNNDVVLIEPATMVLEQPLPNHEGNHEGMDNGVSNQFQSSNNSGHIPSPEQQRNDVIRLLRQSRRVSNNTNECYEGEAYFVIDFGWWKQWCLHVDIFHQNNNNVIEEDQLSLRDLLPPGAVGYAKLTNSHNDNHRNNSHSNHDNHSDTDSSYSTTTTSTSDDEEYKITPSPPLAINNSNLILSKSKSLHTQQLYDCNNTNNNNNNNNTNEDLFVPLERGLVRGHHYELLPRETYAALKCWYGEVTPSIHRRTTSTMNPNHNNHKRIIISLYPELTSTTSQYNHHFRHPNKKRINTAAAAAASCATCHMNASKRCTRCYTVFYCSKECQSSHWMYHKTLCAKTTTANASQVVAGLPLQRWGRCGLTNLGNTCFMNSALQCLSHTYPLTLHVLTSKFKHDLNESNPLGSKGRLALAYETTIKELWLGNVSGTATHYPAIMPTHLKRSIAMFASSFAGSSQHDAQEFLAYLLDGLHEDLNRVKNAPYVEMPDANDNINLNIAGAEAWDAYKRRNNSLILDTFYGQFKSTCICPMCQKVSVSFDAFNHVSLEIPQKSPQRTIYILLFPKNNNYDQWGIQPIRYAVSIPANNKTKVTMLQVKNSLSNLCGVKMEELILADVYEKGVYELYQDNKLASSVRPEDVIAAYEVDPYPSKTIHAIISHVQKTKVIEQANTTTTTNNQPQQPQQQNTFQEEEPPQYEYFKFGFPLLTSIDSNATCRQLREYLWRQVRRCVCTEEQYLSYYNRAPAATADDDKKGDLNRGAEMLQIQITDQNGNPIDVFPQHDDGGDDDFDASILPHSNTLIKHVLGSDCTERYLFLTLTWLETFPFSIPQAKSPQPTPLNAVSVRHHPISEQLFLSCVNHPSINNNKHTSRNNNTISLDECFRHFTTPERLDEHNQWYCNTCKKHVRAKKTMALWKLSNVLMIHLKRFDFKHNGIAGGREKLDTFVDFPINGLDMGRYVANAAAAAKFDNDGNSENGAPASSFSVEDDGIPAIYDLFAVINHYGRMGFGHYTAYARRWDYINGMEKEWALFDDGAVRNVGDGLGNAGGGVTAVVSPAAYVLFYRRRVMA